MPHCDYGVVTTSSGRLIYALRNNVAQGLHAAPSGLDLGDIANRTTRLTEGGILPPVVEAAHTPTDQSREYNISATRLTRNDHRSARLEQEKIELKARIRELERRLARFGELSETLAEMGVMPR